jgi:hypothetical protein
LDEGNEKNVLFGKSLHIMTDFWETGSKNEWEVHKTLSGLCPMAGFSIISATSLHFIIRKLVVICFND